MADAVAGAGHGPSLRIDKYLWFARLSKSRSIAQKLAEKIKQDGYGSVRLEGLPAADWVVLDAGDVVVHLFRPEVRSFYNIERMWSFGDEDKMAAGGNA